MLSQLTTLSFARRHGARLATLDRGVAAMAGDNASDVVHVSSSVSCS
jgi:hypothetical protein